MGHLTPVPALTVQRKKANLRWTLPWFFMDVTPCGLLGNFQCFEGTWCLSLQE